MKNMLYNQVLITAIGYAVLRKEVPNAKADGGNAATKVKHYTIGEQFKWGKLHCSKVPFPNSEANSQKTTENKEANSDRSTPPALGKSTCFTGVEGQIRKPPTMLNSRPQ